MQSNILPDAFGSRISRIHQDGAHPYQITDLYATPTSGLGTAQQTVTYTAYDRPAAITQGDKSATFTYDANHERVKMHLSGVSSDGITRYYVGGRYG